MTTRRFQHVRQSGMAQATPLPVSQLRGGDPRVWILGSGGDTSLNVETNHTFAYPTSTRFITFDQSTAMTAPANVAPFVYTYGASPIETWQFGPGDYELTLHLTFREATSDTSTVTRSANLYAHEVSDPTVVPTSIIQQWSGSVTGARNADLVLNVTGTFSTLVPWVVNTAVTFNGTPGNTCTLPGPFDSSSSSWLVVDYNSYGGTVTLWGYSESLPMFNCGFHDIHYMEDFASGDLWGYPFLVVGSESKDGPVNTARMRWNGAPEDENSSIAMHHYEPTFGKGIDDPTSHYHVAAAEYPPPPEYWQISGAGWWDNVAAEMGHPAGFGVYHNFCVLHSVRSDGTPPHPFILNNAGAYTADFRLLTSYTFTTGPATRYPGHTERIELWYTAINQLDSLSAYTWWNPDDDPHGTGFWEPGDTPGQSQVFTLTSWSNRPTTLKGYQIAEIYNSATRPTTLNVTYPAVSLPPWDPNDPGAYKIAMCLLYSEPTTMSGSSIVHIDPLGDLSNETVEVGAIGFGYIEGGTYTPGDPHEDVIGSKYGMSATGYPGEPSGGSFSVGTTPVVSASLWKAYGITAVFA